MCEEVRCLDPLNLSEMLWSVEEKENKDASSGSRGVRAAINLLTRIPSRGLADYLMYEFILLELTRLTDERISERGRTGDIELPPTLDALIRLLACFSSLFLLPLGEFRSRLNKLEFKAVGTLGVHVHSLLTLLYHAKCGDTMLC